MLLAESAGTIGLVVDVCSPTWLYSALIFSYNQVLIKDCLEIPLTPAAKSSLVKRASEIDIDASGRRDVVIRDYFVFNNFGRIPSGVNSPVELFGAHLLSSVI